MTNCIMQIVFIAYNLIGFFGILHNVHRHIACREYISKRLRFCFEPDGIKLESSLLTSYVTSAGGKQVFRKTYDLQPGDKNAVEFHSADY